VSGQLIDFDPYAAIATIYHDLDDKTIGYESVQDATDIVEVNKAFMADTDEHARYGDMGRVAQIPTVVWFELVRKGIAQDEVALRKWLNDPDNRLFRTRPGRV
jgi:hypothetical protein